MAAMQLVIERLAAGGAELELPGGSARLTRLMVGQASLSHPAGKTTGQLDDVDVEAEVQLGPSSFLVAARGAIQDIELAPDRAALGRVEAPLWARHEHSGLEARLDLRVEQLGLGGGAVKLGALELADIRVTRGPLTVTVGGVSLPAGATLERGVLAIPALRFERVTVELDPLTLGGARGPLPGLGFLDALNGHLNVDITLDLTAPVLGHRRGTHRVRLPIVDGTINFKTVEQSLAFLEDSVLDFELEGETLILEKDLPLVPFDNTTLIRWHLDPEEQQLARQQRVRLRRLLDYEVSAEGDRHIVAVELHRLELAGIDLSLDIQELAVIALGGLGRIQLGGDERPGLLQLSASGELRHDADGPCEPTEIALAVQEVNGQVPGVHLAGWELAAGAFRLGAVHDARVTFAGLRPRRLELTLGGGEARDLRMGRGLG